MKKLRPRLDVEGKMVTEFELVNERVPKEEWNELAKFHSFLKPLRHDDLTIVARTEKTGDLRNFIGFTIDLLRRGYHELCLNNPLLMPQFSKIYQRRLYAKELTPDVNRPMILLDEKVGG